MSAIVRSYWNLTQTSGTPLRDWPIGFHPRRITALELKNLRTNLRAGNRIRGLRGHCSAFIRGTCAASIHTRIAHHQPQVLRARGATEFLRRSSMGPSVFGSPCRGSRPYSAPTGWPADSHSFGLHLRMTNLIGKQPHRTSTDVIPSARENIRQVKEKGQDCWRTVAPLRIFPAAPSATAARGLEIEARNSNAGIDSNHPIPPIIIALQAARCVSGKFIRPRRDPTGSRIQVKPEA